MVSREGGIVVTNLAKSSLVYEVKEKSIQDPNLFELKENIHKQKIFVIGQGGVMY